LHLRPLRRLGTIPLPVHPDLVLVDTEALAVGNLGAQTQSTEHGTQSAEHGQLPRVCSKSSPETVPWYFVAQVAHE
jgi:hypothetical protein